MLDGGKRGRLDGPPQSMTPTARPAPPRAPPPSGSGQAGSGSPDRHAPAGRSAPPASRRSPTASGAFLFNRPTVIAALYLGTILFGMTAFLGVALAYSAKGERRPPWEQSHYIWLIRTFWIGLLGIIASVALLAVFIGIFTLPAVVGLVIVRCVMAIARAQRQEAMPRPGSWLL